MKRNLFLRGLLALAVSLVLSCNRDEGNGNSIRGYPAPKNQKPGVGPVVVFGDSLASGVERETPFSEYLRPQLGNVLNTAVAGMNSQEALARFEQLVLQFNPKLVIISIGGNDAMKEPRQTVDESINNLLKMIELAQSKGALVLYLGINPPVKKLFPEVENVPDDKLEAAFGVSRFAKMVHFARNAGALAIDDCMEGIWLNEKLKKDQLHPNSAGSQMIAGRILNVIAPSYP